MFYPKLPDNPFSREYQEKEIAWFSKKVQNRTYKNIELKVVEEIDWRLDGYMYKDWPAPLHNVPLFLIDGQTWMSLTPMEIESHYLPIFYAHGRVGVAGLGLGYYVQRILEKEEVEEIVVYELNQDVIDFYYQNFGEHEKLTIICQDVLAVNNEEFDFFYCDIYPGQMDTNAIGHHRIIADNNIIHHYHFWTFESMVLHMMNDDEYREKFTIPMTTGMSLQSFFEYLLEEKEGLVELAGDTDEIFEEFTLHYCPEGENLINL